MKNAISFFTGAGGLDIGIHDAGFNVRLCVEIEKRYCETIKLNYPDWNIKNGDIMEYHKERIYKEGLLNSNEEISLIFGGSPCQSFSTAGRRRAFEDPRGKAMLKFADIIREIKPKAFLLENVKGLLSAALKHRPLNERGEGFPPLDENEKPGSALKFLLSKFQEYNVTIETINAADYGIAQKRERVFIVGIRKDLNKKFEFPEKTHNKNGTLGKQKWIELKKVLSEISSEVKSHEYVNYSEERLKYMKLIPKGGGNWRDLPKDIVEVAMGGAYKSGGGKVGFFRRVKDYEPAPTLLTSPIQKSTNLGHPFEDRPLSIEEYLVIQGFPINYKVFGTINDKYTQIGNAVPVKLAEIIGKAIFNVI
ncbi:DNA (cytosine-5-)-methyltransferase [Clostridium sporogenes]|uniref:DNA cytosine methyltransferase n=1 Tax=Clostridium botulinum TaxID=1491 RepID=UPI000717ACB9|nr:DNA cytosine methyltransferase [Clostridium botulinum]KRU25940.1 DNA (cytosine-5-)-methyltransferase [Clostridium sporogenes]KRU32621.1 DNA (cytosine-5-)-methyltransferase [Clostridium sporogenes]KRU34473.1 DNA (cytosine-5-)-methyltransferase [Clostridium sporogenes]KRU39973.1 DNA (cytosine-5-)-methyltransferase [Clostridium sporogenes]MBZ1331136.1 DNA cytosine methyltransferase [Clostridium botulinum]